MSDTHPTRFECADPILCVENMAAALQFYVGVLGFQPASWGDDNFTCIGRDGACIYLCRGDQGHTGSWVWIGVEDVEALYTEMKARGANLRQEPRNYPWALEMHVEDPDGNILRIGSDSKSDRPYDAWRP